jgi:16S rRNA (cytidine1402-2'-O)-methyltransferase
MSSPPHDPPSRPAPDPVEETGDAAAAPAASRVPGGLYVVATPIGNLGDFTYRAHAMLQNVDAILCEDTRVTAKLLRAYGIGRPTLSYHEHNAALRRPEVLRRLAAGEALALVSDAGTPLISDPGYKLVRAAQDAGHPVIALPGASAVLAALVSSGLPSDRFFFQGFLPAKQGARRRTLQELAGLAASLIVYESPKRLAGTLGEMAEVLGDREAAVACELTKRFESVRRDRLSALAAQFADAPRGEVVIVVAPAADDADSADADTVDARLRTALAEMSLRDAAAAVAEATGWPRKQVYQRALDLKNER